jgi:hypothetical protein
MSQMAQQQSLVAGAQMSDSCAEAVFRTPKTDITALRSRIAGRAEAGPWSLDA